VKHIEVMIDGVRVRFFTMREDRREVIEIANELREVFGNAKLVEKRRR
jgi:hypothetical protein